MTFNIAMPRQTAQSVRSLAQCIISNSKLQCASLSKRVFLQNLSRENTFDLHEHEIVGGTLFHMNGLVWT